MASPELQQLIATMRSRPAPATPPTLAEQRAGMEAMLTADPLARDITCQPADANGVPAEWISAPNSEADRVILYLHGGGYVVGSIASHRQMVSRIARAAAARCLAIDYRLAPEHPFPAAVDDAVSAYRWLLGLKIPADRIVVAGDSAGGGLTVATLVALKDQGLPQPAAGVCISPWVDLACEGDSMKTRATIDPMIAHPGIVNMAQTYYGSADAKSPLASPIYADLSGLAPLLIMVGTSEVLFDDSTRLDARARSAGVDVTFEAWNEMPHVWTLFAPTVPEGQQGIERIGRYVQERVRSAVPA